MTNKSILSSKVKSKTIMTLKILEIKMELLNLIWIQNRTKQINARFVTRNFLWKTMMKEAKVIYVIVVTKTSN